MPLGTYYVKEGYIPSGCSYKRDNTVYTVNVTKNHTTTAPLVLRVSDKPVAAPLSVLLQKRNATTAEDGQADMSGAEYTVSFYTREHGCFPLTKAVCADTTRSIWFRATPFTRTAAAITFFRWAR